MRYIYNMAYKRKSRTEKSRTEKSRKRNTIKRKIKGGGRRLNFNDLLNLKVNNIVGLYRIENKMVPGPDYIIDNDERGTYKVTYIQGDDLKMLYFDTKAERTFKIMQYNKMGFLWLRGTSDQVYRAYDANNAVSGPSYSTINPYTRSNVAQTPVASPVIDTPVYRPSVNVHGRIVDDDYEVANTEVSWSNLNDSVELMPYDETRISRPSQSSQVPYRSSNGPSQSRAPSRSSRDPSRSSQSQQSSQVPYRSSNGPPASGYLINRGYSTGENPHARSVGAPLSRNVRDL